MFRKLEDGTTQIAEFFQEGCMKARMPRPQYHGEAELVVINTSGGLTGGDRSSLDVRVGQGASALVTTPGCERIYRSIEGEAVIEQRLEVGRNGRLDWIPQETILYNQSRTRRRVDIHLEEGAEITAAEAVLFGRLAMGETITDAFFSDRWSVHRSGRLIFADATRIGNPFSQITAGLATLGQQGAMAFLLHVGRNAVAKRDALRTHFSQVDAGLAGAGIVDEVLVARIVAPDGAALRRMLIPAITILRNARPMPRLWSC